MFAWGRLPGVDLRQPDYPPEALGRILTHIDCFAGPGGICTGFHAAGIETLIAIERVGSCADTYRANHPRVKMINRDIREVGAKDIAPHIPDSGVDILTSGMPCETFSTAGCKSRSFYDDRQFLFREAIRIAEITNAKILLFENVPAIASKRTGKNSGDYIIRLLEQELQKAGYANRGLFELNARNYGVPQRRRRLFIMAARDASFRLGPPLPRHNAPVTVGMALAGLPDVIPNSGVEGKCYTQGSSPYSELMRDSGFWNLGAGECDSLSFQMPMRHRAATLERFALLSPGESLKELCGKYAGEEKEELVRRRMLPKKMYIQRNYRLRLDEPVPTVTSHCLDEFVHPVSNRALTVRECARLQSFPDCYDFAGGPYITPHSNREVQDKYEQIGDAVPPLLAYAWGKQMINIFARSQGIGKEIMSCCASDCSESANFPVTI